MKLFFSLLLTINICHSRDLFIISGPESQKEKIEKLAKEISREEPFTENLIAIFYEKECRPRNESILQICLDSEGEQKIIHANKEILNRIFGEIKKEELSIESSTNIGI
jgi:hypothetical protein